MILVTSREILAELSFASRDRMVDPSLASGFYPACKFKRPGMRLLREIWTSLIE